MSRSLMEAEIASQPEHWRAAANLAVHVTDRLPQHGSRVAVVGCGTSWFIAKAYAALRESEGLGYTDAFAASEFPSGREYDHVLAISRSGTTTEIHRLLTEVGANTATTAITGVPAEISAVVDSVIDLSPSDEQSVVQTRFATSALALLRSQLGHDLHSAINDAQRVLDDPVDARIRNGAQFTFLGTGWTVGLAEEAALKLREAATAWTEAYPAHEYRHGPISIAEEGRVTWMFGAAPPGLADDVRGAGALYVDDALDPMADLVRAQMLAAVLAGDRGLDPDHPRHLTRSVVLA